MVERSGDQLARAFQEGDASALEALIKKYEKQVYNVAWTIAHSHADAEDARQETFMKVCKDIDKWRGEGSFQSWLLRVAANTTIDIMRNRRPLPQISGNTQEPPWYFVEKKELEEIVEKAIQKLGHSQREMISLRHFQGYSIREIAQKMGCAEGTVKATLFQAFNKLRDHLAKIME